MAEPSAAKVSIAVRHLRAVAAIADKWWTDSSIAEAINHINGWDISVSFLNRCVSKDGGTLAHVDTNGAINESMIFRHEKKVNRKEPRFFYFQVMTKPVYPSDGEMEVLAFSLMTSQCM